MVSEAANTTIIALFGILLGVSLQVFSLLMVRARAATLSDLPRSNWISLTVIWAIVALLILTIHFTPVRMLWVPFLVSFVVANVAMVWVFEAAKAGHFKRRTHD